jgi:hypothetical protein
MLVLVGVSAALRAWASQSIPTPWIAPDELIYADLGRSFWQNGHFELWGHPVALYSAVYPFLAGLPLSLGDRAAGYELLKGLQAVALSLIAVPVYLWGRELVSRRSALVAAALTLAAPSLAYSGLVMSEVAFYPLFVLAAWAVARAVALPTPRRQALAVGAIVLLCATRLQAVLFLPAYLTAAVLDAAFARDRRRLRAHLPVAIALLVLLLAWMGWQLRDGGPFSKVLGAYRAAGETGYSVAASARFVLYHLGDVVLISGVVPFCALVLLAASAFRGSERDERVRAFVATTLSLTAWMTVEVGVFASRHVGHLAERNLFPLVPLLALALMLWLGRGAQRSGLVAAGAALASVGLLAAVPFESLTTLAATPSAFTQIPLLNITQHVNLDVAIPLAAAVLLGACALLPRRVLAVGIPVLLVALGAAASVSASRFIVTQSKFVQYLVIGPDKTWVDDNASGPTAYLDSGQLNWEVPWQARFWNHRLVAAGGFLGAALPGGLPAAPVGPNADGSLHNDRTGAPFDGDYVITNAYFAMAGVEVYRPRADIVLWHVDQPPRLLRWLEGVSFDGLVASRRGRLYVYACNGGTFRGKLSSDVAQTVTMTLNGLPHGSVALQPGAVRQVAVPIGQPTEAGGVCLVDFTAGGPFYLREIGFS